MPASRRCTVLSVTLLAFTLSLPACRGSAGSQKEADSTAPSPHTPGAPAPGEIKWSVISLAGKRPSEAAVLPLRYYHTYLPVIPVPPPTARDYDARMAFRETALKMVEQNNIAFFNALKDAVGQLDISREWQESYEKWLKIGHEAGGFLVQLEKAHQSGEVCPTGSCGAGAPKPEGCPHTHKGRAQWAPDGSLIGVYRSTLGDTPEEQLDTVMMDFGCVQH